MGDKLLLKVEAWKGVPGAQLSPSWRGHAMEGTAGPPASPRADLRSPTLPDETLGGCGRAWPPGWPGPWRVAAAATVRGVPGHSTHPPRPHEACPLASGPSLQPAGPSSGWPARPAVLCRRRPLYPQDVDQAGASPGLPLRKRTVPHATGGFAPQQTEALPVVPRASQARGVGTEVGMRGALPRSGLCTLRGRLTAPPVAQTNPQTPGVGRAASPTCCPRTGPARWASSSWGPGRLWVCGFPSHGAEGDSEGSRGPPPVPLPLPGCSVGRAAWRSPPLPRAGRPGMGQGGTRVEGARGGRPRTGHGLAPPADSSRDERGHVPPLRRRGASEREQRGPLGITR